MPDKGPNSEISARWPQSSSSLVADTVYENRQGGAGANIYFRSERFPAKELLERVPAMLQVDGVAYEPHDLSMNGVSYTVPENSVPPRVGQSLTIKLNVADTTAFEGTGEVVRTEPRHKRTLVALRLTTGFLDIPGLVRTQRDLVLKRDLARGALDTVDRVPSSYRRLCADMVACLRHYESIADRYEQQIRTMGGDQRGSYEAMLDNCFTNLAEEWANLQSQANTLIRDIWDTPELALATKRFTESVVTRELLAGPRVRTAVRPSRGWA